MTDRMALVLGASGSVGQALVEELVRSRAFARIVVVVRRSPEPAWGAPVVPCLVADMRPDRLAQAVEQAAQAWQGEVTGFSVLGVGAGTARMTIDEHRAVDVELNAAFARGLQASGKVRHLAFMSAIGADATARATGSGAAGMPRYARVKGEAEAAVMREGPPVVSIFRPAMILGSRHTPALLAALLPVFAPLTPARFRSIRTREIAQAMVAAALQPPARSAVYSYPEMMRLIAGG
ncbi:MAG: NAD(P)H-binding protein [Rhodocyclaceae bacterium]|nr:NAD(P)H-binding protein [Rhodocyclaceae bacterium]MDQ7998684.1 NAD(P)H-binding protein [Pseudomonadota bacterium]